jgi:hypothetical protein
MKRISLLLLCTVFFIGSEAQSNKKITKVINSIPTIVDLIKNKQVIQNILNSQQGIEKGALYNYLTTITTNPTCARLDSFLVLKKDFYTNVDSYNGLIGQLQARINATNTLTDFKALPKDMLEIGKQFIQPINGILAVNIRAISLAAQTNACYNQSLLGILKFIGGFIIDELLNYIKENQLAKLKKAINAKLEELKIDKMDALWVSAEEVLRTKSAKPFDERKILVQSVPANATGEGYTELTFESAVRELGLEIKTCYTEAEIAKAFSDTKKIKKDLWDDKDFYTPAQVTYEKTRLAAAREALLRKYKCSN